MELHESMAPHGTLLAKLASQEKTHRQQIGLTTRPTKIYQNVFVKPSVGGQKLGCWKNEIEWIRTWIGKVLTDFKRDFKERFLSSIRFYINWIPISHPGPRAALAKSLMHSSEERKSGTKDAVASYVLRNHSWKMVLVVVRCEIQRLDLEVMEVFVNSWWFFSWVLTSQPLILSESYPNGSGKPEILPGPSRGLKFVEAWRQGKQAFDGICTCTMIITRNSWGFT